MGQWIFMRRHLFSQGKKLEKSPIVKKRTLQNGR